MDLRCDVCGGPAFSTRHAFDVHVKSSSHQRVLEGMDERARLRAETGEKEARAERFRSSFFPKLDSAFASYAEQSQETLGGIYAPLQQSVSTCKDLGESVELLYAQTRPRAHVVARRKALYKLLFRAVKTVLPEASVEVYGSIPHKIDDEGSDVDMSIRLPPGSELAEAAVLDRVGKAVELYDRVEGQLSVTRILHARIPVISVRDSLTDTSLDLSMWNIDKLHISEIFQLYFEMDKRIRPLVYAVRKFSKVHAINDSFGGFVNSFGWTVAICCFMMNRGLVPSLDVDQDPEKNKDFKAADSEHPLSCGALLVGFLEWFLEWNYQTTRLTMRVPGGVAPKEAEKFEDYTYVCMERPRTPYQNITRQVEKKQWRMIRNLIASALAKLKAGAMVWDILK